MPPALRSPAPVTSIAALTPFASAIAPASAMRAISTTAPTINRSPITAFPPLLAAQVSGRYRAGMHRAIDSITPYFVRLRRSAAVGASTDFEGESVSRAVLAPTAGRTMQTAPSTISVSHTAAPRASAGAVWMARAAISDAPTALPATFAPVSRLSGAATFAPPSAPSSLLGGTSPSVSRSGENVNRATVPFAASSISASRSVLRNALPSPANGGVPAPQTRASGSVARSASFPAVSLSRFATTFAPVSVSPASATSPINAVSRRAEAQNDAGFAVSMPSASTAARAAANPIAGATVARQVAPFLPRVFAQAPVAGRVQGSDDSSSATVQTKTFPMVATARSMARAREPFVPVLAAASGFAAPFIDRAANAVSASIAPTAERTFTPDLPAPGRPSVPQALWRQAAPNAPSPIERGSGADYVVSQPAIAADFAPAQNTLAARPAPIEAFRSPLAPVSRRGDSASSNTAAAVFRAAEGETTSAVSGSETTAPETAMRTLTPFVPRSAAPFVSRAATMARAMALPATSAILSLSGAAFAAQPFTTPQTGAVAHRATIAVRPATVSNAAFVSRAPLVARAASEARSFAVLPTFAPTVSRLTVNNAASFPAAQAAVNRHAAFVPAASATQTTPFGASAPFAIARAVSPMLFAPLGLARNANGLYRTEDVSDTNGSAELSPSATQTTISTATGNAAPGFVSRYVSPSLSANDDAPITLSPTAFRAVAPMGFVSRMPLISQAGSLDAPPSLLARQTVSPAPITARSFGSFDAPIAPISRAFVPVSASRGANDTTAGSTDETAPESFGPSVLRDFQIARVFAMPAFSSPTSAANATNEAGATPPSTSYSAGTTAASTNAFSTPAAAFLARQFAPQNGQTEPRAARATLTTTAPFISRISESAVARNAFAAPARTGASASYVSPMASPRAASPFVLSRVSRSAGEADSETAVGAMANAGDGSAARSVFLPSFAAPSVPLLRAAMTPALSLPNAPFTQAARQNSEAPNALSDVREGMGTVAPRFVARLIGAAPFASPISAFVNRAAQSGDLETAAFRSAGETGNAPSSQLFATRGAAYEMARTVRNGTLTTASLARQPANDHEFSVQRAADTGEAPGPSPAPGAAGGAGGDGKDATDLMAVDRQVDVLWDRFMQRLRIEQERAGFH